MAVNLRNWAWVAGGVGGMGLVAFATYAWRAGHSGLDRNWITVGALSLALVVTWLWLDRAPIARLLRSRSAQRSGVGLLLTGVVIAIVVAANVLAHRHDRRWDLTSAERFSLSEQTLSVVAGLDTDIEITAFFVGESLERTQFEDLIGGYQEHTDRLTVSFHDPVLSPRLAEEFKVESALGTIVLNAGVATQRMESDFGEESLTNAIIRVTAGREHTICTLTGHGELDSDDPQSPASISGVVTKLERINYTFETITLMRERGVPERCSVLVAADPRVDWLAAEREILAQYLSVGGQVVLMLDPEHAPLLATDLARYGIDVGRDIVLESNPKYQLVGGDASYLLLDGAGFADHPITEPIQGMVMMRVARSVGRGEKVPGIEVRELMHTSEYAWGETVLDGRTPPQPDIGVDRIGRVPVAAVAAVKDTTAITVGVTTLDGSPQAPTEAAVGGRIVVFGDSDFTSNELLDQASNLDLLQNTLAWLVGEGDQVSIRPNPAARGSLTLDTLHALLMWLLSVFVVPCVAMGGAIATWLGRRRR